MLLALGPLLLDTTVRTVVVGLLEGAVPSVPGAAAGADALWLRSPTPEQVASAHRETGLPIGVCIDDVGVLDELVSAGAVAVECASSAAIDVALDGQLTMWCLPVQADRATAAGIPPERLVREPGDPGAETVSGATVPGHGPRTWGAIVRATHGGVRIVRTTDVHAVRRVVTVMDRLAAARAAAGQGVAS